MTLAEAALIAGVIQSPYNHSPFTSLEGARDRRQVVLRAMADAGYITDDDAATAAAEPIAVVTRSVDNEAPYFVDFMAQELAAAFPGVTAEAAPLDIYTTLDLNLQRAAQDAVRDGLARVDGILARRRRPPSGRAQAALVAVDPRTGEIIAMVGGRSYNQSQFNRAVLARRQPGSTFKPFVYLAAFEQAAEEGRADLTPATMVWDEPTTWTYDQEEWTPRNYDDEYDGNITLRRALALSRNIPAIKVAEQAGFDRVAALWRRTGVGQTPLKGYPSIALGVFELSPLELATAYTTFPNQGRITPLRCCCHQWRLTTQVDPDRGPVVARPQTTYLVTSMMRSVLNEGTGAGAARRNSRSTRPASRARPTICATPGSSAYFRAAGGRLRDSDDNQLAGPVGGPRRPSRLDGLHAEGPGGPWQRPVRGPRRHRRRRHRPDTGRLATPTAPPHHGRGLLAGTEPLEACPLHGW